MVGQPKSPKGCNYLIDCTISVGKLHIKFTAPSHSVPKYHYPLYCTATKISEEALARGEHSGTLTITAVKEKGQRKRRNIWSATDHGILHCWLYTALEIISCKSESECLILSLYVTSCLFLVAYQPKNWSQSSPWLLTSRSHFMWASVPGAPMTRNAEGTVRELREREERHNEWGAPFSSNISRTLKLSLASTSNCQRRTFPLIERKMFVGIVWATYTQNHYCT